MVEDIGGLHCSLTSLFAPEDEVDPAAKVTADVLRLERFSLLLDEKARITLGPRWKLDIVDGLAVLLTLSESDLVRIREEIRQKEEFGGQLSDVAAILAM
jgi:hypothetical protein